MQYIVTVYKDGEEKCKIFVVARTAAQARTKGIVLANLSTYTPGVTATVRRSVDGMVISQKGQ